MAIWAVPCRTSAVFFFSLMSVFLKRFFAVYYKLTTIRCCYRFVMELLSNEYHLIGPVVSPMKRNGCSLDCKGRTINDASKRWKSADDQRNGVCRCVRLLRRSPRQDPRSPREKSLRTSIVDHSDVTFDNFEKIWRRSS